ncbi:hypothetical protein [Streptosporangium longisporum]|uniref:Uncharacterized protein n=1 Tax=Streptosporangium longisporum TaxID=46187 RepID=A0ABP6L2T8_9ACTN
MTRRSYTSASHDQDAQVALDFELDDTVFIGEGGISIMDLSEYARLASQGVDSESPEGVAILADVYRGLLGDRVYNKFRAHCRKHRTDGKTLVAILQDLISAAADRPTSRPSDSSAGPPPVPGTSKVVSFSRGTVLLEEPAQVSTAEPQVVSFG